MFRLFQGAFEQHRSLRLRLIKKIFRISDFVIEPAKFENGFHLQEIRPQGELQFRNPNPDFMDFLFTVRLGNPKKDLQNYSRELSVVPFLLIMLALARTQLRTVFQILFRIFQSVGKNEIQQQISQR